jgi:hypothetical protein
VQQWKGRGNGFAFFGAPVLIALFWSQLLVEVVL